MAKAGWADSCRVERILFVPAGENHRLSCWAISRRAVSGCAFSERPLLFSSSRSKTTDDFNSSSRDLSFPYRLYQTQPRPLTEPATALGHRPGRSARLNLSNRTTRPLGGRTGELTERSSSGHFRTPQPFSHTARGSVPEIRVRKHEALRCAAHPPLGKLAIGSGAIAAARIEKWPAHPTPN